MMALLRGKLLAGALFAGALFGPVSDQAAAAQPDTSQGVARNLAENLARLQRQDCRVTPYCHPVSAGSDFEVLARTASRVDAEGQGAYVGTDWALHGASHAHVTPTGAGASSGTGEVAVSATAAVSAVGTGCRVGGGRIRTHAAAAVLAESSFAVAVGESRAYARGIHNPTDEEMLAMAFMAIKSKR